VPGQLLQVGVGPAAVGEFGEERGVRVHALQPVRQRGAAVVVAAEPTWSTRRRRGRARCDRPRRRSRTVAVGCPSATPPRRPAPRAALGVPLRIFRRLTAMSASGPGHSSRCSRTPARTVTMTMPAESRTRTSTSSGTLRGWSTRAAALEWEKNAGCGRGVQRGVHCGRCDVGQVGDHAERLHSRTTSRPNSESPPTAGLVGRRCPPSPCS
jgi:hypothetical protein